MTNARERKKDTLNVEIAFTDTLTNEFLDSLEIQKKLVLNDYSMIGIQASKLGKTEFVISDRGAEYHYLMEVYMDNNGHIQVDITPQE